MEWFISEILRQGVIVQEVSVEYFLNFVEEKMKTKNKNSERWTVVNGLP